MKLIQKETDYLKDILNKEARFIQDDYNCEELGDAEYEERIGIVRKLMKITKVETSEEIKSMILEVKQMGDCPNTDVVWTDQGNLIDNAIELAIKNRERSALTTEVKGVIQGEIQRILEARNVLDDLAYEGGTGKGDETLDIDLHESYILTALDQAIMVLKTVLGSTPKEQE